MMNDIVRIRIERFDPEENKTYSRVYDVPRGTKTRVLDFLVYIFEKIDPSLAYRRHLCRARMCNGCLMMVNGKPRLACWELISPDQTEINLSPLKGKKVLKDLVVDLPRAGMNREGEPDEKSE